MPMHLPITRLWLGPVPLIVTVDPKIIQELLNNDNALEKAWLMKTILKTFIGDPILISEGKTFPSHAKRNRSILARGFSLSILKSYFKLFADQINILTDILDKEINKETFFDIYVIFAKTTLDSICASSLGVNINAQQSDSSYFEAMRSGMHVMMARGFNPLKYPDIIYRFTKDYKETIKCKDIVRSVTTKIISEKRKKVKNTNHNNVLDSKSVIRNEFKKPLLEYLIDFSKENPDFTDEELADEVNFTTVAAFDTLAKSLSLAVVILALYKDVQKRVCDELFQVLKESNRDEVDFDNLPELKYMEMVIKEMMRIFPAVPLIVRELTEDINIENYTIPKGANVAIPIYCLHRNEKYWEDPLKFDPERFLAEDTEKQHPYAFIPFSGGARGCLGSRYAWIFMKLALAKLLSRYEFHTSIKDLSEIRIELEMTLGIIDGAPVRITPRQK
ncbi:cytochrome P450 4C1-like [Chrysoperla carnea]|uniref:cytochrome P450 4C1-like n=1 Tax=Chrysoperla carnea TaxID=189513 RepID=UPI001D05CC35|nr:cytochrome P450 4C1-like [Chrysoperla carnea]